MYKSLDTIKYTNKLQFIILKMVYSSYILYEILFFSVTYMLSSMGELDISKTTCFFEKRFAAV